jgi:CRISPR/Cas system-associated endoribonuclease Cas2
MTNVAQVATAMQTLLTTTANTLARSTGFTQRRSSLTGAGFAQALVFGWLSHAEATLEELSQSAATCGCPVSPQAIDQRFTSAAATFLHDLLGHAVQTVVTTDPVAVPLLQRFAGVYLLDSSTVVLPAALATFWPGCGGSASERSAAALKVQVCLDLATGRLAGPYLQAGRANDGMAPTQTLPLPPQALRLADLGYFNLDVLRDLDTREVYWLSRLEARSVVFDQQGKRWALVQLLQAQPGARVELSVQVGSVTRVAARLLAIRVPQEVADERRRKLRVAAQRKQKAPSAASLALADWTVFITNAPREVLSLDEALALGRARWQIELLFKLWKSHGQIDVSRSQKPWRVLCEVYAKLLAMVVQHWLLLISCWRYPDRSVRKAAQTVRRHALHLAANAQCATRLAAVISTIQRCLTTGCRINKRKARPHTYQLLLSVTDGALA